MAYPSSGTGGQGNVSWSIVDPIKSLTLCYLAIFVIKLAVVGMQFMLSNLFLQTRPHLFHKAFQDHSEYWGILSFLKPKLIAPT